MELPFTTVDVFTDKPFEGNPLAIVTIPASVSLTQEQKQTIAREFNYSETTFVHEDDDPASTERRFDIFKTTVELPFAGHPTVGTAVFLKPRGIKKLIAKAGPIAIDETGPESVRAAIPHNNRLHQKRLRDLGPGPYSNAPPELATAEIEAPVFSIVDGMTFALVELSSLELLASAKIGPIDFRQQELLDEGWRETLISRYYYVRLGTETVDGRVVHKIRTRLIEPDLEDPATGSAACALSSYLSLFELSGDALSFEITQGVEMGRRSNIYIDTKLGKSADGARKLETLHLGGTARKVMSGTIFLES
ncbi:phenazine biosynthesis-like protein [Colletotrichum orchidophilum]|uniref:Phenazine biosynthesis-like protein n=1 Tax=Colletotrichum orchidophilum TaxID=1209926 RepID=A0A1G4B0Z5_9PEZI|nr:phenazine biosynthesis-like protein [Colletotrichum orchidophilum]OHE95064.1 phenazine biosynthesis-like protein [Colletotrichum orchidophilum]